MKSSDQTAPIDAVKPSTDISMNKDATCIQSYLRWKWESFSRRRFYLVQVTSAIMILMWRKFGSVYDYETMYYISLVNYLYLFTFCCPLLYLIKIDMYQGLPYLIMFGFVITFSFIALFLLSYDMRTDSGDNRIVKINCLSGFL